MERMLKTCSGWLFALALEFVTLTSAFAVPIFTVTTSPNHPGLGETFTVNVVASGVVDLYDYQFDLVFDPLKLQYVGGGFEGPFLATAGSTFFFGGILNTGEVDFVFDTLLGPAPGASGGGVLASFDFRSLPTARGATTIALANVLAQDTPGNLLDVQLASGAVTVPEPSSFALLALAVVGCVVSLRKKGLMLG